MAMIVQVHQDKRYYSDEDLIPDGTVLEVVKKWWYMGVLTCVHVVYKKRDICLHYPDCTVISM